VTYENLEGMRFENIYTPLTKAFPSSISTFFYECLTQNHTLNILNFNSRRNELGNDIFPLSCSVTLYIEYLHILFNELFRQNMSVFEYDI
jgi:hypothetical protein